MKVDGGITSIALRGQGHQVCNEICNNFGSILIAISLFLAENSWLFLASKLCSGVVNQDFKSIKYFFLSVTAV